MFLFPQPTMSEINRVYNNNGTINACCDCVKKKLPPPYPTCELRCRISCVYHTVRSIWQPKMDSLQILQQTSIETTNNMLCTACKKRYGFYIPCFVCRKKFCADCVTTTNCSFCNKEYNITVLYLIKNQTL